MTAPAAKLIESAYAVEVRSLSRSAPHQWG
jgi:hypothetical protein